jgi:prophage regulatory protein
MDPDNTRHHKRADEVAKMLGVTRKTVWAWVKSDPTFPRPVSLSPHVTVFLDKELQAWFTAKQKQRPPAMALEPPKPQAPPATPKKRGRPRKPIPGGAP